MEYNTQGLYMVLAGRFASWQERTYLYKIRSSMRRAVEVLFVLAGLLFAFEAYSYAEIEKKIDVVVCTLLIGLVTAIMLIWFLFWEKHQQQSALQTQWYDEQADKTLLFFGCMYSLYDDRIVYADCRCQKTLYWKNITVCLETPFGFLVETDSVSIYIRAADLTSEQAEEVRIYLCEHDQNACYRKKATLYGRLSDPLPLPVFENEDEVITRAQIVYRDRASFGQSRVRGLYEKLVFPVSMICGTIFAEFLTITDIFFVDLLLFCVGFIAISGILTVWLSATKSKKRLLSIAFTGEGIALSENGNSFFVMNSRIRRKITKKVLLLTFSNGTILSVPLANIEDAEKIMSK